MAPDHELLQLARLFDFVEDVVAWVKDPAGRYCWVNRAFLLNYDMIHTFDTHHEPSLDVLGKTDYELSPGFLADQYRIDDEYVLAGNQIVNRIEQVGQPDGPASWCLTNKIPLRNRQGKIVGTAGLTRRIQTSDMNEAMDAGFGRVLSFMRDHYATPLDNQQLARAAHMSLRAFERRFQASFHLTPQHYLRRLRLGTASRALVFTSQSLVTVANRCGFSDQSHFTREFRRHFGRTPKAYREFYSRGQRGSRKSALSTKTGVRVQ
jgi:AraC-like DNA-binding protein